MSQETRNESKFDPFEHLNIALNPDGSLTRFVNLPTTPVSGEDINDATSIGQAVASKEIVLDAAKKTTLRIYRPTKIPSKNDDSSSLARLPIIFYFHAGGWILMSVQSTIVHEHCCSMSNEIPAIIISVGYRLAPESRLPSQYDDAIDAIKWLQKQAMDRDGGDRWIRDYGDISRCYLYGASCGGNIAFNTALRIVDMDLAPLSFPGMILNQPLFGGKKRTKSEISLAADPFFPLPATDLLWDLALPPAANRDHRYCNPLADGGPSKDKIKSLCRTLIIGFGGDPLIERQQAFVKMLVLQGVQVEARFDDIGFHGIDMVDSRRAAAILSFVKEFV